MQDNTSCPHDWAIVIRTKIPIGVSKHCASCGTYAWKQGEVTKGVGGSILLDGKEFASSQDVLSATKAVAVIDKFIPGYHPREPVTDEVADALMAEEGDGNVRSLDEDAVRQAEVEAKLMLLKLGPFNRSDFVSVENYEDVPEYAAKAANHALKMILEDV